MLEHMRKGERVTDVSELGACELCASTGEFLKGKEEWAQLKTTFILNLPQISEVDDRGLVRPQASTCVKMQLSVRRLL